MRKEELMGAAVELFKKKGYHATSVEDITASIGISKGGFYRHFKTKEILVLELLNRFYNDMVKKSEHFSAELQGDPLLILKKKITIELEQVIDYHYFFHAVMNEFSPTDESAIPTSLNRIFEMLSEWHKQALLESFGYKLEYINDLVLIMEGAIHSYLGKIVWNQIELQLNMVAYFIVESLQAIVNNDQFIYPVLPGLNENEKYDKEILTDIIEHLTAIRTEMGISNGNKDQTIDFLIQELKQQPRAFLVDALFKQLSQEHELERKLTSPITAWEVWKERYE
ncbi:TetR/AcrR family transcriptional regulator [Virgibacillus oceani]